MCVFTRKHRPPLTAVFHHHPRKFAHLPLRHPHISSCLCAFIRETEGGGGQNWIIHRSVLHHQLPSFQTERLKRSQICHYNDFIFTCCVAAIKEVMDVSHDPFFFLNGNLPTTWINQFFLLSCWIIKSILTAQWITRFSYQSIISGKKEGGAKAWLGSVSYVYMFLLRA